MAEVQKSLQFNQNIHWCSCYLRRLTVRNITVFIQIKFYRETMTSAQKIWKKSGFYSKVRIYPRSGLFNMKNKSQLLIVVHYSPETAVRRKK